MIPNWITLCVSASSSVQISGSIDRDAFLEPEWHEDVSELHKEKTLRDTSTASARSHWPKSEKMSDQNVRIDAK